MKEHLIPTYNRFPVTFVSGDGTYLYDENGKEYLDFGAGIAVNSLGHQDAGVKKAITDQLDKVQHVSNLYYSEPLLEAAEVLADATGMDQVFFTNSGTEAVEGALKLARRYQSLTKNPEVCQIVSMLGSFHGRTLGAVTVTGQPDYHKNYGPMLPEVYYATFNDLDSVKELVGENTAAVIVEPIKGEGGIVPATPEFLKGLRELCDATDTLLIFDEVQCGAGRTGNFLASEAYGVKPDILAVAKGIGAGFPVGAFLTSEDIGNYFNAGTHGSTYGGNPLACAVVREVVPRISSKEFLEEVKTKGEHLKEKLTDLKEKYPEKIKEVRGTGLIQGIEFYDAPGPIVNKALEDGLVLISAANNTIRIIPPLTITIEEIDKGIKLLDAVLAKM